MLSEKLTNGELFRTANPDKERQRARSLLNSAVQDLISAMRAIEGDKLYTREEIESFVLARMRRAEEQIYAMDDEEFDSYLDARLVNALTRWRMKK